MRIWEKAWALAKREGITGLLRRWQTRRQYRRWRKLYAQPDRAAITADIARMASPPLISVVMPVYDLDEPWLRAAIDSVRAQLYPHWELCIADDCSPKPHVRRVLEQYAREDSRIRVVFRDVNGHISEASNSALALARGQYVALLDHDDALAPDALYWVARELIAHPEAEFLYSDEDKLNLAGEHSEPHAKPEWDPDYLLSLNYASHFAVHRASRVREVGGFRKGFEGGQDTDLTLRVTEMLDPARIRRIPRVLYHWRMIPGSVALGAGEKTYAHEAARRAVRSHLERRGIKAEVVAGYGAFHRVRYALPARAVRVSVIGEHRDLPRVEGLELEAVRDASQAAGEILLFWDAGLAPDGPAGEWIRELVSQALRPEIGAVGAKLVGADGNLAHTGYVLGLGSARIAASLGEGQPATEPGYAARAVVVRSVCAVSAGALAIRRELFAELGGWDMREYPAGLADLDLCLRARERGLRNLWTPFAALRGSSRWPVPDRCDDGARARFRARWGAILERDPYYSPNLALGDTCAALAFPPRF